MGFNDCKVKIVQVPVTKEIADTIKGYIQKEKKNGNPKFAYKVYSGCLEKGFKQIKK